MDVVVFGEGERVGVEILVQGMNADGSVNSVPNAMVFVQEQYESSEIELPGTGAENDEVLNVLSDSSGRAYVVAMPDVMLNIASVRDDFMIASTSADTNMAVESLLTSSLTMRRSDWLIGSVTQ